LAQPISLLDQLTQFLHWLAYGVADVFPPVIWAALIALGGVILSNRGNTKRLIKQMQHEASENAKDRISATRREVYAQFTLELSQANGFLASIPTLDPGKSNLADGLAAFAGEAAKVQLLAEPGTALLVGELASSYATLMLELMLKAMPAHKAKTDINVADERLRAAVAESSRALGEMTKYNESGNRDQRLFEILKATFKSSREQADKYASERAAAWAVFHRAHLTFLRFLMDRLSLLAPKNIPVLVELRRDLGLSQLDGYEEQLQETWEKTREALEQFIKTLEAQVNAET